MDEPIIAKLLAKTADYQDYDTIALYDITSYQQTTDEPYDFNLQIPKDADITLYQTVDGQLQESTLDVMYTEDEYNRLPLVSYQSETNHWLVFYLGAKQTDEETSDSDHPDCNPEIGIAYFPVVIPDIRLLDQQTVINVCTAEPAI